MGLKCKNSASIQSIALGLIMTWIYGHSHTFRDSKLLLRRFARTSTSTSPELALGVHWWKGGNRNLLDIGKPLQTPDLDVHRWSGENASA